ncbi:hypothetical protein PAXRUDRAFT_671944 [Paxillus rubicundulus Ve08.2h10]|uniref:WD40 repeat-like protein n=1 Tax=Paxillus rubicundulus Ve08.2h10 TaxID=930991 RepID=A0A0D0E1T1_9AGAM|nr:hypothetical protein PAXRUDRAFT_671944 [Paxillus rubicundulus Ve08.2h10]
MSRLYNAARNAYWRVRGLPLAVPSLVKCGHTDLIRSVAFLPDGQQVISGSNDGTIRTWRLVEEAGAVETAMKEGGVVVAVAVSSDGQWIATGGEHKTITIWNATTHEKAVELKGHFDWVRTLRFSPDSARVASGSDDWTVVVWSTATGKRLAGRLKGHAGKVYSVAFAPDGDKIASCSADDIRIWHSHTGVLINIIFHVGHPRSLEWTPNGQKLIAGCKDGSINVIHATDGALLAEWYGHASVVCAIAVSPNGELFASGSWDKTIRLWNTVTRKQIGPALQHDGDINSVAISPDGRHLASGGDDRKVRIWSLQGIIHPSILDTTSNNPPENASSPPRSDNAIPTLTSVQVLDEEAALQQIPEPHPQETQDTQSPKDDDVKGDSGGAETSLKRRPSESSSLRDFLDCQAVSLIGATEDRSHQLYANFFENDSRNVQLPLNKLSKKRFSKFLNKFSLKKQDRSVEPTTQPEGQPTVSGEEGNKMNLIMTLLRQKTLTVLLL